MRVPDRKRNETELSQRRSAWGTQALRSNWGSVWHRGDESTAPKANYALNSRIYDIRIA